MDIKRLITMLVLSILCIACEDSITQAPIQSEKGITAAYKMAAIDSLAKMCGSGLMLYEITSLEMTSAGTSAIWYYDYQQARVPPYPAYRFQATFNSVAFLGKQSGWWSGPVTHNWLDSDIALAIAEKSGGGDFRNRNPDCTIVALLIESEEYPSNTYWRVGYRPNKANAEGYSLFINALTGVVSK
jgi:hypothetical protein